MRWPGQKQGRGDAHIVDRGRVWCPAQRRDVDVDRCLICGSFEDLAKDGDIEILRCRPVSGLIGLEAHLIGR